MPEEPPDPAGLNLHYRWCDDPECPVAYVYEGKPHYHFTGSGHHPAEMPDDPNMR